jgi:hypothetical protein
LAYECANLLIGRTKGSRSEPAWQQVYRALDHEFARRKCANSDNIRKFPKDIADFAAAFVTMQTKRHKADYDPFYRVLKTEVESDILLTQVAISKFLGCKTKHRRAFCAYVLLKERS